MTRRIISFDLDSTVADTGHRQHLIDREKGTDWDVYSQACSGDDPVVGVVALVRLLAEIPDVVIVGLSARKYSALTHTLDWFAEHNIPIERVFLDETDIGDYKQRGSHSDYKLARAHAVEQELGGVIVLHVDDYAEVSEAFNADGIPTICVRTPQEIEALVKGEVSASLY